MCTLYLSPSRCTPRRSRNRPGPQYAEGEKWGTTWTGLVVAQGGGVAASAVPQNSQNFSKLSEFSEFSEFLEFFRIFAKSLKSQNFRKIQNFRSLYGIFSRIVKGGDPNIAFYLPEVIYYLLSALLPRSNILLSAPSFPYNILLSALPSSNNILLSVLLSPNNILPTPSHPIPRDPHLSWMHISAF